MDRKFLGIVVHYPGICTYPEYEGKPYYSIKYEENGEMIVGYGTYKPEVLSQYLREDFISPAEPERKKGYWIVKEEDWRKQLELDECSECGFATTKQYNFCPNCGADMW